MSCVRRRGGGIQRCCEIVPICEYYTFTPPSFFSSLTTNITLHLWNNAVPGHLVPSLPGVWETQRLRKRWTDITAKSRGIRAGRGKYRISSDQEHSEHNFLIHSMSLKTACDNNIINQVHRLWFLVGLSFANTPGWRISFSDDKSFRERVSKFQPWTINVIS